VYFSLLQVGLIIGIAGACRKQEMAELLCENVKDEGKVFHIEIPKTKTKISREFFVTSGGFEGIDMVQIIRKYMSLRPRDTDNTRFFVGYRKGKCIRQPVGINTFGSMPKAIATFLKLPHPELYTGHCFRRSSTSMLADSGADLLTVKRHGGWKSNSVAEGYIDTSKENKKNVAKKNFRCGTFHQRQLQHLAPSCSS
jgi:integrase